LSSEKKLREKILAMKFDPLVRVELKIMADQIRSLNQSIAELEKTIADQGSKLEGHRNLTSIKGIGPLTGSILLSVIGDINFCGGGQTGGVLRDRTADFELNQTEHSGRTTKRGSKLGRTALV